MLQKDQRSPINTSRDATFFHIRADKLLLMCATKGNPNAMLIFEYLYAMAATFNEYFGELNATTVHRNSSVIYELIDDMLDYGFPQITGADKLKAYIRGDGEKQVRIVVFFLFLWFLTLLRLQVVQRTTLTQELTGQNTFRPPDLTYKKNEIYIDVVESINLLLSKEGQKLSEEAVGKIQLRTYLSGTPQCKFGFNDSIQLREAGSRPHDVSFFFFFFFFFAHFSTQQRPSNDGRKSVAIDDVTCHQCVKLHAFEKTREIQFVPPDGAFDLMQVRMRRFFASQFFFLIFFLLQYRVTSNLKMPFIVSAIVNELGGTRVDYRVQVTSQYPPDITGTKV
jgi:AP-2 complex subunit mu-1